ncbi:hypothetical protein [Halovivax cerinus]|uniref:DUF4157 domain-containing protein n=1 Tax=Halovivax cerinus TaxID=1487865 RepID=A0ABD5NKR5_9EURY|nr:hypothetical protein [Halovivax cerinus]
MADWDGSRREFLTAGAVALGVSTAGCSFGSSSDPQSGPLRFDGVDEAFRERTKAVYDQLSEMVGASISDQTTIRLIDADEMRERAGTFQVVGGSTTQKLAYRALGLLRQLDAERPLEFAGAYYPGSTTIRLVGADEGDIDDQLLAHELFHAIQFQTAGVTDWDRSWSIGFDRYAAQQALVEGAAMFAEDEYVDGCGGDFAGCHLPGPTRVDPDTLDPALLLTYGSYFNGHDFVAALAERGGWDAIWDCHDDPPSYSGQVLRPEWYPDREPESVAPPTEPEGRWTRLDTERLGMQALFTTLWHEGVLPGDAVYTRDADATDEVYTSLVRFRSPVTDALRGDAFTGFESDAPDDGREDGPYAWLWRIRFTDTAAAETAYERFRHWAETRGAGTDLDDVWHRDGRFEALALDGDDVVVTAAPTMDDLVQLSPVRVA